MRFLICPSAYKGTLSSLEVAEAIKEGVTSRDPDAAICLAPIADGGDGTIDALQTAAGGTIHRITVQGPLNDPVEAKWIQYDEVGVVELASASGLAYVSPDERNALEAHTFGLGSVMRSAIEAGIKRLTVCVGGSASTDGGSGALRALDAKFFDRSGADIPLGGGPLIKLTWLDTSALDCWSSLCTIQVAVDVTNPLTGQLGAARIFGPQKGALPEQVDLLDQSLMHYADLLEAASGRVCRDEPGAGAAGGTAFGIACGLGAKIVPGFSWIANLIKLEEKIYEADAVITAEGSLDEQSLAGKASGELAKLCARLGRPLMALPAVAQDDVDWLRHGIRYVLQTASPGSLAEREDVARSAALLVDRVKPFAVSPDKKSF